MGFTIKFIASSAKTHPTAIAWGEALYATKRVYIRKANATVKVAKMIPDIRRLDEKFLFKLRIFLSDPEMMLAVDIRFRGHTNK